MKKWFMALIGIFISFITFAAQQNIVGAGSTFVYPVLAKWADQYEKKTSVKINYQPIGSGGGIQQLKSNTVDFAASDMPLNSDELTKQHWLQFPIIIGGIVPTINVPDIMVNQLTLDGSVLADIFLGNITKWNDERIQRLNPNVKLPDQMIVTIHRADGSGTTYNFTHYLSQVSQQWQQKIGTSTVVQWPGDISLSAKGNAGVAAQIKNTPYSIGYLEFDYALQNKMTTVAMINKTGKKVLPSADSFAIAASNAKWSTVKDFDLVLTNQPGKKSWPIVATTFVLLQKDNMQTEKIKTTLDFFRWIYTKGNKLAVDLDYVGIPSSVVKQIENYWQITDKKQ